MANRRLFHRACVVAALSEADRFLPAEAIALFDVCSNLTYEMVRFALEDLELEGVVERTTVLTGIPCPHCGVGQKTEDRYRLVKTGG